jgi:NAD+ diphosphatase
LLSLTEGSALLAEAREIALLGLVGERALFAADLSHREEPPALPGARFADLRSVGPLLAREEGGLLAYARGLMHWHQRHRFCGVCGSPTESREAGHMRRCTNPACAAEHHPRTDPAVIMRVEHQGRILLGRQKQWPVGMHSVLAGFVEPGESLEDAVVREVLEETGVAVGNVRYHSSQPWPFPSSLMLGFFASAAPGSAVRVGGELEDARWFTRAQVTSGEALAPPSQSISWRLIESWLNGAV